MSSNALNALQENASRLGMRLQESFSEHTRDFAIAKPSSASFFDTGEDKVKNIRRQLESNQEREKLEGLKRLIAMISKGRNVAEFFAQVVKNVASPNLEIRKLVYIYLLRYAEHEPDLALLSINTFQKDLTDPNPLIRAMALRVLSGIKVPMIASIVGLGIKRCSADPSPYVRKAAALAIPKLHSLDASHFKTLQPILLTLLRDRSPVSVGCVAVAFNAVCPQRLDLLHGHYRRLCRVLIDVDEWGQTSLMDLLLRYARHMLTKPPDPREEDGAIDPDVQLLLSCSEPLFQSRNPAVVLSACRIHFSLTRALEKIVSPLLRIAHAAPSPQIERVVLSYLVFVATEAPNLLIPHHTRFFVKSFDLSQMKRLKVQILLSLVVTENVQAMVREFTDYASDTDDQLVTDSIHALGRCARLIPDTTPQVLAALMNFIQSDHDVVVSNAVLVLKSLVQSQLSNRTTLPPASSNKSPLLIIARLARSLDEVQHPSARACILWLVGQYAGWTDVSTDSSAGAIEGIADWAPDVLRKAAKRFSKESPIAKLQTATLAAKLLVLNPTHSTLGLLSRYVFSLARYDLDYDVRDRARTLGSLLAGVAPALRTDVGDDEEPRAGQGGVILRREQVKVILFDGKVENHEPKVTVSKPDFLGSLSTLIGKDLPGDRQLPDWLEEGTDSSLRDTEDDRPPPPTVYVQRSLQGVTASSPRVSSPVTLIPSGGDSPVGSISRQGHWMDLDKFYEDENDDADTYESRSDSEGSSEDVQNEPAQSQLSHISVNTTADAQQLNEGEEEEEEDEEEEESEEESEDGSNSVQHVHSGW